MSFVQKTNKNAKEYAIIRLEHGNVKQKCCILKNIYGVYD